MADPSVSSRSLSAKVSLYGQRFYTLFRLEKQWAQCPGPPPFVGHSRRDDTPMAAIERTAYPRFPPALTASELQTLYAPTDEERAFVAAHTRGPAQSLT